MASSNSKKNFLNGKNILITGASKGIGKYVAKELALLGANIILLAQNEKRLDEIYDDIKENTQSKPLIINCNLEKLDEEKSQEIANVIAEEYNVLDYVIHNAATVEKMTNIENISLKTWEKILKVNLTSSFLLTKYLIPLMDLAEMPRIIFTSSGVAFKGEAFWGAYSVSKSGVKVLSEILNDEMDHKKNFKVFNFNPKATRTDMRASVFPAENPNQLKEVKELMPYYIWMLSENSNDSSEIHIEYGDEL